MQYLSILNYNTNEVLIYSIYDYVDARTYITDYLKLNEDEVSYMVSDSLNLKTSI